MGLLEFRTWLKFFTEMNEEPNEILPDASEMSGDALAAAMGATY